MPFDLPPVTRNLLIANIEAFLAGDPLLSAVA